MYDISCGFFSSSSHIIHLAAGKRCFKCVEFKNNYDGTFLVKVNIKRGMYSGERPSFRLRAVCELCKTVHWGRYLGNDFQYELYHHLRQGSVLSSREEGV